MFRRKISMMLLAILVATGAPLYAQDLDTKLPVDSKVTIGKAGQRPYLLYTAQCQTGTESRAAPYHQRWVPFLKRRTSRAWRILWSIWNLMAPKTILKIN